MRILTFVPLWLQIGLKRPTPLGGICCVCTTTSAGFMIRLSEADTRQVVRYAGPGAGRASREACTQKSAQGPAAPGTCRSRVEWLACCAYTSTMAAEWMRGGRVSQLGPGMHAHAHVYVQGASGKVTNCTASSSHKQRVMKQ